MADSSRPDGNPPGNPLKIALIDPYYSGSHRRWGEEWRQCSSHSIRSFTMKGRHWKWRMHGGAVHLAEQLADSGWQPDLLLVTGMLDLCVFKSLLPPRLQRLPAAVYFHETQFTYPRSGLDSRPAGDYHYGFINYTTALAAQRLFFNSQYHHDIFLESVARFLPRMPDYRLTGTVAQLRAKAKVLPLALDLAALDNHRCSRPAGEGWTLLWNHRWEYDKGPELFFGTLDRLQQEGVLFNLIVTGGTNHRPPPLMRRPERFGSRLLHCGSVADPAEYARLLWQADLIPVTSRQDFFGGSLVEAMYCETRPLVPDRLAFPEHVPAQYRAEWIYAADDQFYSRLRALLRQPRQANCPAARSAVIRYDWSRLQPYYDRQMAQLVQRYYQVDT